MALPLDFGSSLAIGALGLVVIVVSADVVVDRATAVANHFDVPEELVAMTIIAIGTSLPEIATGTVASAGILSGTFDPVVASATVLGGNMGSSTVQQLPLFGIFLVGFGRLELTREFLRARYLPMIVSLGALLALSLDGTVSRIDGLFLLAGYLAYLYYSYTRRRRTRGVPLVESTNVGRDVAIGTVGLLALLGSSFLVLDAVNAVVDSLALGGSMVGVVTIGIAAALPELSTIRIAIRKQSPTLALGTLVGSNVVNSLVGVGLGAAISTYVVPSSVVLWDLPFKIAVAAGLLVYLEGVSDRRLGRSEGMTLIVLYLVFVAGRLVVFPGQ